jgi:short subunit dehydrogenase-like uncharacterized protein
MAKTFLIYGAYGYTGELIAEEAKKRGHQPLLAGRNREPLEKLASRLGLPFRVVDLGDERALAQVLGEVDCVVHSAGPFSRTAQPMVNACLKSGKHYLDITGEIAVFEACHARGEEARAAGVMLLPGVGFDVVPSDCLAAHVKRRLPEARKLTLAFVSGGSTSRGTTLTMIENLHAGGAVRKDGKIVEVPQGWKTRSFDFGRGPTVAMTIPWGDVSTAYHSTGIPDIEVYAVMPGPVRAASKLMPVLRPVLASGPVQKLLKNRVKAGPPGPTPEQRARTRAALIAEAEDASGRKVASRLHTPEGYTLTARTAVLAAERVLKGEAKPGFQTPSLAFGADFALEAEGVSREDLR